MIAFSCGFCGAPLDENRKPIWPVPAGYNPDDYIHDACGPCAESNDRPPMRVTREMALDAGDPDLEGTIY